MAILYSPKISADDYNAFRRILHSHLPDTYDEWLYLETKQCADWLGRGHTVRNIEVDPDEFVRYCNTIRARRNLQDLRNFTAEKSGGKQY
jgi:ribosome biogenesis SPOUT family RNA methylase Rps3